jgi:hypothetical protein
MFGKKMRRIKLFESFEGGMTEQEIRGALVELVDVGYDVLVTKLDSKLVNGYTITISAGGEFFDIANVSEPILELIAYFEEKFGDSFVYSIEYINTIIGRFIHDKYKHDEVEIEDLEQFVKDNPLEDTDLVTITLRIK